MTAPTRQGIWLQPAEVDLLCTFAEVSPPFPLAIPSHGATADERQDIFRAARAELSARGLADHRGPQGLAAAFVGLLRDGAGSLDLIVARRGGVRRVLVLTRREQALVARQDSGDSAVQLLALSTHDAVEHLMRMVPDQPPAMAAPFSLPRRAVDQAHREILAATGRGGDPRRLSPDEVDRILRRHGLDDATVRRMATHLQPVLGNGQAGIAVKRGYAEAWTRSGEELRWLDTARGRFRIAGGGQADWMSVNPLPRDDLRTELRALAQELWQ
ncbi:ESX secretion-associated protein EspG [Actinokineospora xionganensis]|uniref:ESX secretion-associated protein EspG n=1 Tax=Actinokineospora xionganensis TaxID=2684470 RepID=A0ABR7LDL2_9PSEU|nr:ESX secretion-associated protein EspG [Actinokineospora xionganensis]MBC6450382.1 ESX secretion-associated protein EspG [Actinokineospora xionganensis]